MFCKYYGSEIKDNKPSSFIVSNNLEINQESNDGLKEEYKLSVYGAKNSDEAKEIMKEHLKVNVGLNLDILISRSLKI